MAPRRPPEQYPPYPSAAPPGLTCPQQQPAPQTQHQRHGDCGSADEDAPPRRFLTGPQVCARYSITEMSLWRWLHNPEIGFPQPALIIKSRRYFLEADLTTWERNQAARRTGATT